MPGFFFMGVLDHPSTGPHPAHSLQHHGKAVRQQRRAISFQQKNLCVGGSTTPAQSGMACRAAVAADDNHIAAKIAP